eukprot:GHVR01077704.1.p1 GENE.GHVR01077704.1~~GHVR01077704.1.p1  ORF type:complete len:354 (+),score=68.28 GHVR01077704.1:242-1303(+)
MLLGTTNQNLITDARTLMSLPASMSPQEAAQAIGLANSMYSTPVIDIKNWIISNNPVNEEFRRLIDSIEGSEILEGAVVSEGSLTEKLRSAVEEFSHELIISPNNASELKSIASLSGLYFGGKFETKFHHKNTVDSKCWSADGSGAVDCQLMRTVATVKLSNDDGRIVCIPYKTTSTDVPTFKGMDGPFYLVFASTDLYKINQRSKGKTVLKHSDVEKISEEIQFDCDNYEEKKVYLWIPRLRITSFTELTDLLEFTNLKSFRVKGNLSNIAEDAELEHIAQVMVLEVDSEDEESDADVLEDTKGLDIVRWDSPTVIAVVAPGNQVLLAGAIDDFTSVIAPRKEIHTLVEIEE